MSSNKLRGKVAMVAAYATQQGEHPHPSLHHPRFVDLVHGFSLVFACQV